MSRQIEDPYNLTEEDIAYISVRPNLRREFILQGLGDPLADDYAPEEPDESEDEEPEDEEPEDDYDDWKKAELEAEVEKREIQASGTKADLIEALRANDNES